MRFRSALLMCACVVMIAGCGFRPLYQNTTTLQGGASVLDSVTISSITGASGHMLKNELIDRFYNQGYPDNARYVLVVQLQEFYRDIVIQKNDVTSRAQIVLRANYQLQDKETRQFVDHGDVRAVGSYNVLGSQYATAVTQKNVRELALKELADKITLRVATVLQK